MPLIQDDWWIKRFLLAKNRNVDKALEALINTMKWRNDFYVSETRDFHFPIEFYKIGALFVFERDLEGRPVLYMRIRMHKKVREPQPFVDVLVSVLIQLLIVACRYQSSMSPQRAS